MSETVNVAAAALYPVAEALRVKASGPVWRPSRMPVTVKVALDWFRGILTLAGKDTIPDGVALRATVTALVGRVFRVTVTSVLLPLEIVEFAGLRERLGPLMSRICTAALACPL